ncbi:MAG: DUF3471 domain-containing protein, partial [Lewinella sp.]|nr:DUF3471 domain-containing protein [Lewinella sp.]
DQEEEEIVEEESLEETDAAEEDNDRRVAGTHYQHELADYAGVYLHPAYGEVTVSQENDQLQVQYYSVTVSLEHFHFETFFGENEDGVVVKPTFITDANGKVVALEQVMEPMLPALRFDKQPADRLSDPAFLQIFVGEYQFGDDGPVITVELAEDHLRASIPGQPTYDLEPLDGTEFRYKQLPPTFTLEFILENDEPVAVVSHQPNGSFRAKRVEE